MTKHDKYYKFYAVLLAVVLIVGSLAAYAQLRNAALKKEIETLSSEKQVCETQVTALNTKVQQGEEALRRISSGVAEAKQLLADFKREVDESAQWFKTNADIGNFREYDSTATDVQNWCVQLTGSETCYIKLGCFPMVNEEYQGLKYQYDIETTGKADKLQSLTEIHANGGGDCEDYSLLVKAELNYLKSHGCSDRKTSYFRYEAVQYSQDKLDVCYIDYKNNWRYPEHAKPYELPMDYTYYYVICGSLSVEPGVPPSTTSGHCTLAFTNKQISSSADVDSALKPAIVVEPQSGFLIYDFRYAAMPSITVVISDGDYYLKQNDGSWMGYGDFYPKIDALGSDLDKL